MKDATRYEVLPDTKPGTFVFGNPFIYTRNKNLFLIRNKMIPRI